jgi:hypothetical protein
MREFESFLSLFIKIEGFFFLLGLAVSVLLKGFSVFSLSFVLGYAVVAVDYFQLVRFSRRLPELVRLGVFPKSGFMWRYLSVLLILVGFSLFTPVDFFAIISAVALSQIGLFLAVLVHRKEWRKWKEA